MGALNRLFGKRGGGVKQHARWLALAVLALLPLLCAGQAAGQGGIGTVTITGASAEEGEALRFWVGLNPALTTDVVVELETAVDTSQDAVHATADADFAAVSAARLTIHTGASGAWFTLQTIEDGVYEGDETFAVRIAQVAEGIARVGALDRAVGTITEDDPMPELRLHQAAAGIHGTQPEDDAELTLEGGSANEPADLVYRVYLSAASGLDTTVPYTLSGTATAGTDYTDPTTKQLVIPAGALTGEIRITTLSDTLGEDHESVIVTLGAPTNATVKSGAGEATGRIFDDDREKHIVLTLTPHRVPESVTAEMTYTLTATLGGGATAESAVTVGSSVGGLVIVGGGHTVTHGSDIALRDALKNPTAKLGVEITIAAGQRSGTAVFKANIIDDDLDEYDESVGIGHHLANVANSGELHGNHNGYTYFYPRLTITDNDQAKAPTVSVANAAAVTEGNDSAVTTDMTFTVNLSAASGKDVTVWYSLGGTATAGADYDTPPLSLAIAQGAISGTVTIPVRGDTIDEGASETVQLTLLGAKNAELARSGTSASGQITDDDTAPTLSVADSSAGEGTAAAFTVSLSQASGRDVTFSWSTADDASGAHPATAGADYTSVSGRTVVIPAGTQSVQVSVQTLDDNADEHAETFKVILSNPVNAALASDPSAIGTINADAADPQPTITIADAADVAEGDDPAVTADMSFPVTLSEASGKDVMVTFAVTSDTATAGNDYIAPTTTTLTIPAGQTTANIIVRIKGDSEDELHDILTVTLSNPVHATLGDPYDAQGMIRDNEGYAKPWVSISFKEQEIYEGDPITLQVRAGNVAKEDIPVNFYVYYHHHGYSSDRVEKNAWFVDPRGTGLQIATIPAGSKAVDFIIQTRVDQADFDGYIWAAMLTPGLMKSLGFQNLGHPDGGVEPYVPEWDSFKYHTGQKARQQVDVKDWPDDRPARVMVAQDGPSEVYAGEPATFRVVTDSAAQVDTVVRYEVSASGPIVAAADQGEKQITIPAGVAFEWISVPTLATNSGNDYKVTVRLAGNQQPQTSTSSDPLVPISNPDKLGDVAVTVRDQTPPSRPVASITTSGDITEGDSTTFTVRLDAAQTSTVQVFTRARVVGSFGYRAVFPKWARSISSDMLAGYPITFTFPPGETEETLTVTTVDDQVYAGKGRVLLRITPGGTDSYVRANSLQATANVSDNDPPPPPELSVTAVSNVVEGEIATFKVIANRAPTANLDVSVLLSQTGDSTDDTGARTVTIAAGATNAVLTVQTTDDEESKPDGAVTATLIAQAVYSIAAQRGTTTVTVWDDDGRPPGYTVSRDFFVALKSTSNREQKEHGVTTPIGVAWGRVLIAFGISPAHPLTSWGLTAMTLTQWLREVYQDSGWTLVAEEFKVFEAGHALRRSEPPPSVPEVTVTAGKEVREGGIASFAINVTPAPSAPLSVNYTVSQVGDFRSTTDTSFTVTVPTSGVLAVHVPTTNDQVDEAYGSITVTLGSGAGYSVSATQNAASVTISDDDGLPVARIAAPASVREGSCPFVVGTLSHWPGGEDLLWINATLSQQGEFLAHGRPDLSHHVWRGTAFDWRICTVDDRVDEPDGSFTVTLIPSSKYEVWSAYSSVTVNVLDNDDGTVITPKVNISSATGATEGGSVTFTLTASPAPSADLAVDVAATTVGDYGYGTLPTSVTIPTSGSATVTITTTDDQVDELNGSVTLAVNAGSDYTVGSTSSKTVTVADDEPTVPSTASVEGGDPIMEGSCASFTIRLDPAPLTSQWVKFEVTQQGDYLLLDGRDKYLGSVRVGTSGSASWCVAAKPDDIDEPHGSFTMTLLAADGYTVSTTHGSASVVVRDDDDALPMATIKAGGEITEGDSASFTVKLRPKPAADVVVKVTAATTGDFGYGTLPTTVTIPTSGEATVSITTTGDLIDEADGYITLTLTASDDYNVAPAQKSASVLVSDDDGLPTASVTLVGGYASNTEWAGCEWFTVRLNPAPQSDVKVHLRMSQQGEFLRRGEHDVEGWVRSGRETYSRCVFLTDDDIDEPHGSITANLLPSDDYILSTAHKAATLKILDNDDPVVPKPEINITTATGATEGDSVTFTLAANPAPTADLAVGITATTVGDFGYGTLPTSVTIPASGSATVTITTTDDQVDETDGSVTLVVKAGSDYTVGSASSKTVTVADDDVTVGQSVHVVDPTVITKVEALAAQTRHGAAHVNRWQRALAGLGALDPAMVSGGAMTAAEAQQMADRHSSPVWDEVVVELTALESVAVPPPPPPPTPEVNITNVVSATEGGSISFTLSASPAPTADLDVTVTISTVGDFGVTAGSRTVTIPSTGSASLTLTTTDDSTDEADGSVTATLATGSGYTIGAQSTQTADVTDNDDPPVIEQVMTPVVSITGGNSIVEGGSASFTISANPSPSADIDVVVSVSAVGNYGATTGQRTIRITSGSTSKTITVATTDDQTDETDGSITVTLNSGSGYTGSGSAMVAVADNDDPPPPPDVEQGQTDDTALTACEGKPELVISSPEASRSDATVDFAVSLSCLPSGAQMILLVPVRDGIVGENMFISLSKDAPSTTVTLEIGGETNLGLAIGWSNGLKSKEPQGEVVFTD